MTSRQRWTLIAAVIGSGAVFLDGTVVNLALKRIGQELPASLVGILEGQTYIVSGYLAVLAALLILGGALSDHYGRRRVFAIGLASFAVASALCGLAPTMEWLILFRLFQGAAGALLVPGSLALINSCFEGPERGRAFGIWASATSALTLLGPLVGGLLVDTIGWRSAFLINVPVLAAALWVTLRHVQESRDLSGRRFDWLGSAVAAIAVGGLSAGLIRGTERAWQDPLAWIFIIAGVIALIAFPILMTTRKDPLVPVELFRSRAFVAINIATFFIYGALYVVLSYQGLVLQGTLGYTALGAGAIGIPVGILLTLLSTRIGTVAGRRGSRPFLIAGPLIVAAGMLWYARLPVDSEPWVLRLDSPATWVPPLDAIVDILPAVLLTGAGMAMVVSPLVNTLMGSIPGRFSGLGSAFNNSVSRVGQPLLGALIFIVISASFYATLGATAPGLDTTDPSVRQQFPPLNAPTGATPEQTAAAASASIEAFHLAMFLAAALLVIGSAVSFFGLRGERQATGEPDASTTGRGETGAIPAGS